MRNWKRLLREKNHIGMLIWSFVFFVQYSIPIWNGLLKIKVFSWNNSNLDTLISVILAIAFNPALVQLLS